MTDVGIAPDAGLTFEHQSERSPVLITGTVDGEHSYSFRASGKLWLFQVNSARGEPVHGERGQYCQCGGDCACAGDMPLATALELVREQVAAWRAKPRARRVRR